MGIVLGSWHILVFFIYDVDLSMAEVRCCGTLLVELFAFGIRDEGFHDGPYFPYFGIGSSTTLDVGDDFVYVFGFRDSMLLLYFAHKVTNLESIGAMRRRSSRT